MKMATVAVCLLVLTAGCVVQTDEATRETATPPISERIDKSAELPAHPKTPSASKYDVEVKEIEDLVHQKMNDRREAHNLDPLNRSNKLNAIARYKSWDMAQRDYFAHRGPKGMAHHELREKYESTCGKQAQNIFKFMTEGTEEYNQSLLEAEEGVADAAVQYLMNSTGHRKNILEPAYEVQGIGVFVDENGTVYLTQEFCG